MSDETAFLPSDDVSSTAASANQSTGMVVCDQEVGETATATLAGSTEAAVDSERVGNEQSGIVIVDQSTATGEQLPTSHQMTFLSPDDVAATAASAGQSTGMVVCDEQAADKQSSASLSSPDSTQCKPVADASQSTARDIISQILPPPKCKHTRSRKRKVDAAAVLSSSPYKRQLLDKMSRSRTKGKHTATTANKCREGELSAGPSKTATKKVKKSLESFLGGKKRRKNNKKEKKKKVTCRQDRVKSRQKVKNDDRNTAKEYRCIYCNELFVDPPDEDWVQCLSCKDWFHEQCGNDTSVCDICGDS